MTLSAATHATYLYNVIAQADRSSASLMVWNHMHNHAGATFDRGWSEEDLW